MLLTIDVIQINVLVVSVVELDVVGACPFAEKIVVNFRKIS
jgi:hypothetical protein